MPTDIEDEAVVSKATDQDLPILPRISQQIEQYLLPFIHRHTLYVMRMSGNVQVGPPRRLVHLDQLVFAKPILQRVVLSSAVAA